MARKITFVHTSDLHLGAPFRGMRAISERWANRLSEAIPNAYAKVVETALERNVDFVVIAGDVFDNSHASFSDYRCFFEGLEKLTEAGIPVYLCTGNHDPYSSWSHDFFALPEGAHMLAASKPDYLLYERGGEPMCVLAGRGFMNSVWPKDEDIASGLTREAADAALGVRAHAAPFGVGILHTGLDLDVHKAPSDPRVLRRAGFDYWALGHVHTPMVDDKSNPRIAYAGCIQGRDVKETGKRGFNMVTLEEGASNRVEFVPSASITWQQFTVDVSACSTVSAMVDAVMRAQFDANGPSRCDWMISRITLDGETELHDVLARPGVLEDVRSALIERYPDFFVDSLVDRTRAPIDRDALMREGLFPSTFLRSARRQRDDKEELARYLQESFLKRGAVVPASLLDELDEVAAEAEDLVVDLLMRGEA